MTTGPTDRLEALANLMRGALTYETEASDAELERIRTEDADKQAKQRRKPPGGFVEGSEAYRAAVLVGWPMVALGRGDEHVEVVPDLFSSGPEPLAERYDLDMGWLETGLPLELGGPAPADSIRDHEYIEDGTAIGWDEDYVLFQCPRGVCMVRRDVWADGYRSCPGC